MLIDSLITLLTADAGVSAVVSTRVYKSVLPRGYVLPAIVLHKYGGVQDYDAAGPIDTSENQIQFDVYGDTKEDCDAAVSAVKALLNSYTGALSGGITVSLCKLERDMDMPFLPHADGKGIGFRSLLGYEFICK